MAQNHEIRYLNPPTVEVRKKLAIRSRMSRSAKDWFTKATWNISYKVTEYWIVILGDKDVWDRGCEMELYREER